MEKKPYSGELASYLIEESAFSGEWNEDESGEWSESEDDEMGFGLFYSVQTVEDHVLRSTDGEIKQPTVSKDKLGSIFRAQQLVRCSLKLCLRYLNL